MSHLFRIGPACLLAFAVCLALPTGCSKQKTEAEPEQQAADKFTEDDPADAVKVIESYKLKHAKQDLDTGEGIDNITVVDVSTINFKDGKEQAEQMVEVFDALGQLPYLGQLYANHGQVTDAALLKLKESKGLRVLEIEQSQVGDEGLAALKGMTELVSLNLKGTEITDEGVKHLADLDKLTILDIRSTNLGDDGMQALTELDALESIRIKDTQAVTDEGVTHLAKLPLKTLQLNGQAFTNEAIKSLADVESLTLLDVDNTNIDETGLEPLADADSLETLSVRQAYIFDEGLVPVAKMKGLTTLKLRNSGISSIGVETIKDLDLVFLDLSENAVDNAGLKALEGMESLETLILDLNSDIDGEGLASVAKLPNLTRLDIRKLELTDADLEALVDAPKLEVLNIGQNSGLTDEGVLKLKQIKTLKEINVSNNNQITDDALYELFQAGVKRIKTSEIAD